LLNAVVGIDVTHMPYRGRRADHAGPDRRPHRLPVPNATVALPQIESRTIKAIAIPTRDRSPMLPDLASADEQGLNRFRGLHLRRVLPAQGHARRSGRQAP